MNPASSPMRQQSDFNAFVVACTGIARSEAVRLARMGVWNEFDDAVQVALTHLLAARERFPVDGEPCAWARIVMRQGLIKEFCEVGQAVKRGGPGRRDRGQHARAEYVDVAHAELVVDSREDETIARIDMQRITSAHPLPSTDGTRGAKCQRLIRWKHQVATSLAQKTANDNAFIMKEAA